MAEVAAPYFSANDLNSQPGDANLSGVAGDFDPAVKAPLAALQNTADRIDAENFQARKQQQQQQRQFQHDTLTRQMENEHQEKILKYHEGLQSRQKLFNLFNETGATTASAKGPDGSDMSIPFLPDDNEKLTKETNEFQKWAFENPTKNLYSPELREKMDLLKHKRTNASLRSYYVKQAEQAMTNTYDPQEKERLQTYMDDMKSQPLAADKMPHPFVERPTIKPLIDPEKEYKEGKGYEDFGDNGSGVPNSRYLGLASTTDPRMVNEGFKRYQFFRSQPEGQSAQAYQSWKQKLDALTDSRDLPRIDFPVSATQDGKIAFDDNSYAKQQVLARNFLAATELMNNGYLKQPDSEDVLKEREMEARIDKEKGAAQKEYLEVALKKKQLTDGKPLSADQLASQKYVRTVYDRAQKVFAPSTKPVSVQYPSWWTKNGVNPDDHNIYNVSADEASKFIGIEAPHTKEKAGTSGNETVTEHKGESARFDHVFLIEDKNTGEKQLMYVKGGKAITKVPEKEAVINGLKHESKYDPKVYQKKVSFVEDIYKKADENVQSSAANKDEEAIRSRLVPVTIKKRDGSLIKAMKDPTTGKLYAA